MVNAASSQKLTLGDIHITFIPDGSVLFEPTGLLPTTTTQDWQGYQSLLNEQGKLVGSMGAYIVQTANHTLLVDTAYGDKHAEDDILTLHGGALLTNLRQAGFEPDDIDVVFFTHFHTDHVGWTSQRKDGQLSLTFPRARFLTRHAEWQRFDDPATYREGVADTLAVLTGRIELLEDGDELIPGVKVRATPGHTSGHSALVISSGSARAIILGDIFHSTIQLEHPDWTNIYDWDAELAKQTRRQMLQELAQPATIGIGAHFSTSVFGRLLTQDNIYQWQLL
ncbi:MBL fold metallo-hydrolase [Dictyobacter arantiisoli]|uniref:MBL fold metallo-hydrolase n=1 Tax=Dictyobacter arantiisoli TaxID=2014874 RepID=A0A5A5TGB7_9CHLR|nr:MBL fold metallo-hydrolase [Dictyobacter arantiisoli]GCF10620.1 MBL fold metallo-hydrolase [Dictyobacter arantiisoli]